MELEELTQEELTQMDKKLRRQLKWLNFTQHIIECLAYILLFSIILLLTLTFGGGIVHVFSCWGVWKPLIVSLIGGAVIGIIFTISEAVKRKKKSTEEKLNNNDK